MANLDSLYTPGRIGRLTLKNRFIQAAMHTRFASEFGEVSDQITSYLVERARGGVSMIILENTAVDWEVGRAAGNPVRIDQDVFISGLSELTEAIHREGVLIAAQLHHAGRQNGSGNTEGNIPPIGPSPIASSAIGEVPREIRKEEIQGIVNQFAAGARRAVDAGFDMVEIHGSHGYILTQFLSSQSNTRKDEYGGSFENRARFPLEVVRAVREAVGPNFPISYRISLEERTSGGMEAEEGVAFCKLIEQYVDVFNVTAGTYESMDSIFMMQGVPAGALLPLAAKLKSEVAKPIIAISRLGWALEKCAIAFENGELDFVALARTQLTDPQLVNKTRAGEADRVRRCIACNECVGAFLFKGWKVHCVINPELGQEFKLKELYQITPKSKKVVIIGGGPAGFEVARVTAIRGHRVELFEAGSHLGGQVLLQGKVKFKEQEMLAYSRYMEAELAHLGVSVKLNTFIKEEDAVLKGADEIVVATGGKPRSLPPQGAIDAFEILNGKAIPDGDLIVLGANGTGLHVGAMAAEQGHKVTIITNKQTPGSEMNPILAGHMLGLLKNMGINFIDEDSSSIQGTRVWADHWTVDDSVWKHNSKANITYVGSKVKSGGLFSATQSGFWAGTRI
jgi:2,4-dienoyl-CoA reductase (NADPH2)